MKFVHFIGIEGIGLSGAAKILLESKIRVSGSDLCPGKFSRELHKKGAFIYWGHSSQNLDFEIDTVVASNAIDHTNPEFIEAQKRKINILSYPQLLGILMAQKKIGIAVSGTHGKTTTTGLISYILKSAWKKPSFLIGGYVKQLNCNASQGEGDYFVAEACEYRRSFLNLTPTIAIITNIELDHLDYYHNINDVCQAFADFAKKIPENGILFIEKKAFQKIQQYISCRVLTYSIQEKADLNGKITETTPQSTQFILHTKNTAHNFTTSLYGRCNIENCIAAIAVCSYIGISYESIAKAIESYSGVQRRFEIIQEEPFVIIDDYAHHPTEIVSVIDTTKSKYKNQKLWCVFQPHQASRTYHLLQDFASSFYTADEIIISDIFYARDNELDKQRINGNKFAKALCENGQNAHYISRFDNIKKFILSNVKKGDVVLCLGAGNIHHLARMLIVEKEWA